MLRATFPACLTAVVAFAGLASAKTLEVGPGKELSSLQEAAAVVEPGDEVLVYGNARYEGPFVFNRPGLPDRKVVIRGVPVEGKRPVLAGGRNTIEAAANHYVFEGLEITGGEYRCFFHRAHDITLRSSVLHDCKAHGVLGADSGSGTLLLEYTELFHIGNGTRHHTVYMATDESMYPQAVFRMQHCYLHDTQGGNGIKSRAGRNEIYFNWVEGAEYHELELIGPDGQRGDLLREDSDVVGNVFRKTNELYTVRIGGDGTGDTAGRYRFVNNTFLSPKGGRPVLRLFDRVEAVELHNNVFYREEGEAIRLIQDENVKWATGQAVWIAQNNWVPEGSSTPAAWQGTLFGKDPGFENLAGFDLRPKAGSPLRDAGARTLPAGGTFAFPTPLTALSSQPPPRRGGTSYLRETDGAVDIGAYEGGFALRSMRPLPARAAGGEQAPQNPMVGPADPPGQLPPSGGGDAGSGRCGCQVPGSARAPGWALLGLPLAWAWRRRSARPRRATA